MKKKIAIVAGVILVLVLVLAAAFIADSVLPSPKAVSFDDHDLRPNRVEIPVESNGFPALLQAGQALVEFTNKAVLWSVTNWNEAEAREILTANQPALELLHQAWAYPGLQVEAITNIAQDFNYFVSLRSLAQLAILEARFNFRVGDELQGFSEAMNVVQLGQRLQGADGTEIHYLIGSVIKNFGLDCIRQFSESTTVSASNLLSISKRLKDFETRPDDLQKILKQEYMTRNQSLRDLISAETNAPFYSRFVFSERRTELEYAEQIRCTLKALTNCYADGIICIPVANTNQSIVLRYLHGNFAGSILNEMSLDTRKSILSGKCRDNVNVRATRVILALRAYQLVNHHPAATLQDLCPDFLEAVPLDDFDGKPLRYLSSEKKIYSVGADLKDHGGTDSGRSKSGDIVFPYRF